MDNLQIGETFKSLDLFKVLAPIADVLEGKLKSRVDLSGNLTNDLTVDLQTISGNVLAELLAADINPEKARLLSVLTSKLEFIKLDKINLKGLKTALSFEDGMVRVKPFTIKYQDIAIDVDGSHSFDKKLNYKATLQVPSKYLGKDVNALIAQIDARELDSLRLPVTATIGGEYSDPVVSTDFTSGIKDLTSRLVEIEKQKLIRKGTDKAGELIGGYSPAMAVKRIRSAKKIQPRSVLRRFWAGYWQAIQRKKTAQPRNRIQPRNRRSRQRKRPNQCSGICWGKRRRIPFRLKRIPLINPQRNIISFAAADIEYRSILKDEILSLYAL